MNSSGRSSIRVSLPLGVGALAVALAATTALLGVTPAPENADSALQLAFARLHALSSYRMRETIVQPVDGFGGTGVITTEFVGDRSRQVVDFDAPGLGVVRIESVRVGARAAVRADVPAFGSLLVSSNTSLDPADARRLFRQLIGVAISAQIETPASAELLALAQDGARARTPAEIRAAMTTARAWFGTWHRNDRHQTMRDDDTGWSRNAVLIGSERNDRHGSVLRYEQTDDDRDDNGYRSRRIVLVDATTGLPLAEEIYSGSGQAIARIEYFDTGAAIGIELPSAR